MSDLPLPIAAQLPDIHASIEKNKGVVLQAEPGAGKSTLLPLSLLDKDFLRGGRIIMLEPRRVAARSIAHYLAKQLGEKVGQTIGYQVRNDRKHSARTRLEIVTEGVLTRRLQTDPELSGVGLVIFDEFHERSLQADLALMLTVEVQQALREDLKILVMSATLDASIVADYLGGADIIQCPGRAHPVSLDYLPAPDRYNLPEVIATTVAMALDAQLGGDLLVFLPGRREIKRSINASQVRLSGRDIDLLPLYGGLSLEAQEKVLTRGPNSKRRVIFATNIAETSLTIEGIVGVIDSGLERVLRYDPVSDMTRLETARISKASAIQRAGRAGRLRSGQCWRLWPESIHQQLADYQNEEVCSVDLSSALLELFCWGFTDYEQIPWLTPPPRAHFDVACENLERLGLIDHKHQPTAYAERVVTLGVSPRLGAMLLTASTSSGGLDSISSLSSAVATDIACRAAALLNDRDIFHGRQSVDIDERLVAFEDYQLDRKSALKRFPLHAAAAADALALANRLHRQLVGDDLKQPFVSRFDSQQTLGELLLYAFPDRLAKRRGNSLRYLLANGRGVALPEDDALAEFEWLVVADADGQKSDGRIYSAVGLHRESVLAFVRSRVRHEDDIQISGDQRNVSRVRRFYYGALLISTSQPEPLNAEQLSRALPALFAQVGMKLLNWTDDCDAYLTRCNWLSGYLEAVPPLRKASLESTVGEWLMPYVANVKTLSDLKKLRVLDLIKGQLDYGQQQLLAREAPETYCAPSGKVVKIRYSEDSDPTVSLQLQELFGQTASPMLASGKVPLRFELLSPARRPIQTTSDLAGFWQSSYFEVAKDMRGRYPKHRWPEEPLLETAGKSIKSKAPRS